MKSFDVLFECEGDQDYLIATADVRRGISGFRVCRYVASNEPEPEFNWDNSYQFYNSLDEVLKAFETKEYQTGKDNF